MPVGGGASLGWQAALVAFAIIVLVSFSVTFLVTDLGRVSRTPYIAILALTASALAVGYLAWSGTSVAGVVTRGWGVGVVGGIVAAAVVAIAVRRLPSRPRAMGPGRFGAFLWEGVVYGIAEAILLATLPVLAVWQATQASGWAHGWAEAGSGALAVSGALVVIVAHHLGYREFRGREATAKLAGALFACGVQALAFLLTGNVLAPVLAHILLHSQMMHRGLELPPASGRGGGGPLVREPATSARQSSVPLGARAA